MYQYFFAVFKKSCKAFSLASISEISISDGAAPSSGLPRERCSVELVRSRATSLFAFGFRPPLFGRSLLFLSLDESLFLTGARPLPVSVVGEARLRPAPLPALPLGDGPRLPPLVLGDGPRCLSVDDRRSAELGLEFGRDLVRSAEFGLELFLLPGLLRSAEPGLEVESRIFSFSVAILDSLSLVRFSLSL